MIAKRLLGKPFINLETECKIGFTKYEHLVVTVLVQTPAAIL